MTAPAPTSLAQAQDAEQARADYAEWFTAERRAKVWWVIDVVFGALSKPSGAASWPGQT